MNRRNVILFSWFTLQACPQSPVPCQQSRPQSCRFRTFDHQAAVNEVAKEKPAEGEIVSVGEGARKDSGELIAPSVKAGDKVLFGKWSGTEVTIDGDEMLIMKESDILGIIA